MGRMQASDKELDLLDAEVKRLQQLHHNNIINFIEKIDTPNNYYIVMEL
jgi:serine/threonine protein kinase